MLPLSWPNLKVSSGHCKVCPVKDEEVMCQVYKQLAPSVDQSVIVCGDELTRQRGITEIDYTAIVPIHGGLRLCQGLDSREMQELLDRNLLKIYMKSSREGK